MCSSYAGDIVISFNDSIYGVLFEPSYYYPNTLKIVKNFTDIAMKIFNYTMFDHSACFGGLCKPKSMTIQESKHSQSQTTVSTRKDIQLALLQTAKKNQSKHKRPLTAPRIRKKFHYKEKKKHIIHKTTNAIPPPRKPSHTSTRSKRSKRPLSSPPGITAHHLFQMSSSTVKVKKGLLDNVRKK